MKQFVIEVAGDHTLEEIQHALLRVPTLSIVVRETADETLRDRARARGRNSGAVPPRQPPTQPAVVRPPRVA